MCLIAYKRDSKAEFSNKKFITACNRNSDGLGVMYVEDGRVKVEKTLGTLQSQLQLYRKHKNRETYALHLRFGTSGNKDEANCHPFEVLNKEEHGLDLFMMHNGVISSYLKTNKDMSDTWHFVQHLKDFLKADPNLLHEERVQHFISSYIGTSNKLLFMDSEENVTIINEKQGAENSGCWLSNTYSINGAISYPPVKNKYAANNWKNNYNDDTEDYVSRRYTPTTYSPPAITASNVKSYDFTKTTPTKTQEEIEEERAEAQEKTRKRIGELMDKEWELEQWLETNFYQSENNTLTDEQDTELMDMFQKVYGNEVGIEMFYAELNYLPKEFTDKKEEEELTEEQAALTEEITEEDLTAVVADMFPVKTTSKKKQEKSKSTSSGRKESGTSGTTTTTPIKVANPNLPSKFSQDTIKQHTITSILRCTTPEIESYVSSYPEAASKLIVDLIEERDMLVANWQGAY